MSLSKFAWLARMVVACTGILVLCGLLLGDTPPNQSQPRPRSADVVRWLASEAIPIVLVDRSALLSDGSDGQEWKWSSPAELHFRTGDRDFFTRVDETGHLAVFEKVKRNRGLGLSSTTREQFIGRMEIVDVRQTTMIRWVPSAGFELDPKSVIPPLPISIRDGDVAAVVAFDPDELFDPESVTFVLDASGSMRGDRIQAAREALIESTRHVHTQTEFALVVLYDCQDIKLESRFGTSRRELERTVERIEPRGGTPLGGALDLAFEYLHKHSKHPAESRRIVVLSDGLETCGTSPGAVVAAWDSGLRESQGFDIIGIGLSPSEQAALEQLAKAAGGRMESGEADDLTERTTRTIRRRQP